MNIVFDTFGELLVAFGSLALYLALFLVPLALAVSIVYALLSLPLRRRERARLVLDLIETAIREGRPIEPTLIAIASCRDRTTGALFYRLVEQLEKGLRLSEAFEAVPRLLPPQIVAMLKAGERIGDVAKVLPACRQTLNDSVSQVRSALNYLIVVAFVVTPLTALVPVFLAVKVIPMLNSVFREMSNESLPAFTQFVFQHTAIWIPIQCTLLAVVWFAMLAYVGGPRLRHWFADIFPGVPDRLIYSMPWRRHRLHRDFSALLAVLLDSGVPELEAVVIAAETTDNSVMRSRAADIRASLAAGVKLPIAIRKLDDSGELQWRLANALERGRDFLRALTGWHEALDARAFQLEQAAAQLTTSALVAFNAVMVAGVTIAVFLALTNLISEVALW